MDLAKRIHRQMARLAGDSGRVAPRYVCGRTSARAYDVHDRLVGKYPYPKLPNGRLIRPHEDIPVTLLKRVEDEERDYEVGEVARVQMLPAGAFLLLDLKQNLLLKLGAKPGVDFAWKD